MPIPVACQCGQKFAANDQLAGRQVNCPACGGRLQIPAPRPAAAAAPQQPPPAPAPLHQQGAQAVRCVQCGAQFAAGAHMAGQVVPCPRCRSPIPIGAAPGTAMADDLFDELPSIEEQQAALSEEARREQLRRRRKEQRAREAAFRKRAVEINGKVCTIISAVLLLGFAGWHGYEGFQAARLLLQSGAFSLLTVAMRIAMIVLLSGWILSVPLALLATAMLLTQNAAGRRLAIAAAAWMFVTLLTFVVISSANGAVPPDVTPLVAELILEAAIVGLLFFPGVSQHLGAK